jgi:hypothetical protein
MSHWQKEYKELPPSLSGGLYLRFFLCLTYRQYRVQVTGDALENTLRLENVAVR